MADKRIEFNPYLGDLEQCIADNTRMIHKVCQKFIGKAHKMSIDYEEIHSVAMIGFLKAYDRYDPTFYSSEDGGELVQFSTYAVPMMDGSIRRFLRDYNTGPKFTRNAKEAGTMIQRMNDKHEGFICKPVKEIAQTLGISVYETKSGLAYLMYRSPESLSAILFENEGDPITLEDQIPVYDDQTNAFVNDFLDQLPQQYRTIVEMRMQDKSQLEIGKILGVSQVQISRLTKKIATLFEKHSSIKQSFQVVR